MRRVARFLGLPAAQQRLLGRAWLRVAQAQWELWTRPYGEIRARLEARAVSAGGAPPAGVGKAGGETAEEICRAIERASGYVPGAKCLARALAGETMLKQAGLAAACHIGVRPEGQGIGAHAWVECEGRILLGGEVEPRSYQRLTRTSQV